MISFGSQTSLRNYQSTSWQLLTVWSGRSTPFSVFALLRLESGFLCNERCLPSIKLPLQALKSVQLGQSRTAPGQRRLPPTSAAECLIRTSCSKSTYCALLDYRARVLHMCTATSNESSPHAANCEPADARHCVDLASLTVFEPNTCHETQATPLEEFRLP